MRNTRTPVQTDPMPTPCLWRAAWPLLGLTLCLAGPAAAQDPLVTRTQARNLAATCTGCHGTNGKALDAMKPLAGLPADRLLAQLADYRSGAAPATVMHQITKGFSDEQLQLIASHFAAQKARP